jgi:hypothetical protein
MGAAVISDTDVFRAADFRSGRRAPPVSSPDFVGHFASLGQINAHLRQARSRRRKAMRPGAG